MKKQKLFSSLGAFIALGLGAKVESKKLVPETGVSKNSFY